jgi:hypothetical protein
LSRPRAWLGTGFDEVSKNSATLSSAFSLDRPHEPGITTPVSEQNPCRSLYASGESYFQPAWIRRIARTRIGVGKLWICGGRFATWLAEFAAVVPLMSCRTVLLTLCLVLPQPATPAAESESMAAGMITVRRRRDVIELVPLLQRSASPQPRL